MGSFKTVHPGLWIFLGYFSHIMGPIPLRRKWAAVADNKSIKKYFSQIVSLTREFWKSLLDTGICLLITLQATVSNSVIWIPDPVNKLIYSVYIQITNQESPIKEL